jgi:hypothetical protein
MRSLLVFVFVTLLCAAPAFAADKATCVNAYDEGQKQRAAGSLKASLELFRVCAEPDCPAATKKDCTTWLAEVEASLPTVVVKAVDAAGHDLTEVKVFLDEQPFLDRLDGKAVAVDPGQHVFGFERPGAKRIERVIVISQGEKNRRLEIRWAEDPVADEPEPEPDRGDRPIVSPGTWVLGGIGLAGVTVFAVVGGLALADKSDAEDTCAPRCSDSVVDGIRAKLIVADVSLAVGVASLGAAVILGFLSYDPGGDAPPEQAAWSLGAAPCDRGAIGVVSGAF